MKQVVNIEWHGQLAYDTAWDWQKEAVAALTNDPTQADKFLLLEHPPTYTLGRRGKLEHLLLDETALAEQGFTVRWVDRGGDITYHGPGQLVGYPIMNLKRLYALRGYDLPDLHGYLRDLEEVIIRALAEFGINSWRYEGYTGVWVDMPGGAEKIAAIGVKISKDGISSHGFALNVNPDLTHFGHIIPCGIRDHGVTSMARVLERPLPTTALLQPIVNAFQQIFDVTLVGSITEIESTSER
ncbi:MAG: lipoyl(octanoyl) transferase LipB [Anaerolineales bacterium]|nr:lipoyl(octanoyl) transferase LipB [Anaerolineales bacterium]